jgi:hypothetical protein
MKWLEAQRDAFEAVAAAGPAEATAEEGSSQASGQRWDAEGANAAPAARPRATNTIAKHAAIFSLVYGLLAEGEDRRWAIFYAAAGPCLEPAGREAQPCRLLFECHTSLV